MAKTASTPVTPKEEVTPSNETQETPEVTPTPESPKEADKEETPNGVALPQEEVLDLSASAQVDKKEMADDKDAKKIVKEHEKVLSAIENGEVVLTAHQASVIQNGLVPDPISGQPKYETAEAAAIALSLSGKLTS